MMGRNGGKMWTAEMIGMTVFGILVLAALAMAVRSGAKQRAQVAGYTAARGWSVSEKADAGLSGLREEASPGTIWYARNVILAQRPPQCVCLFSYNARPKERSGSSGSNG
jgi:hypothetical protein